MARRGEVLVARRKLGFGAEGKQEHFAVVQSDHLQDLETVLVAPLDTFSSIYERDPLAVRVSAREAGTAKQPHVVLVHLISAMLLDRFEELPVSRLSPGSMAKVDALLRLALGL